MQRLGKAKIGRLSAKGIDYPQLRLPRKYAWIAGKTADIYQTEDEGKQAFLIVIKQEVPKDMVLKPRDKVLKPGAEPAADARISALEYEISELKRALFSNEANSFDKIRKSKAEGEIRTRVVASTGQLPLSTAQMCHKTSFDLSCRTG